MGFITVERHVFYLQAKEHREEGKVRTGTQTHLRVRSIRVPWGHRTARTVGYMDDGQFGGVNFKIQGRTIEGMRDFLFGRGYQHPKLIVADIRPEEVVTKTDIAKKFFGEYRNKLNRISYGANSESPFQESYEDEYQKFVQDLALKSQERRTTHAIPTRSDNYAVKYPQHAFNSAWMFADPTWPGRRTVSHREAVTLGKSVLDMEIVPEIFNKMSGRQKMYNLRGATILGVAYKLHYYQNSQPADIVTWLESINQRVRTYMAKAMKRQPVTHEGPVGAVKWYALGHYDMPSARKRYAMTPRERLRTYKTFRPGVGFSAPKLEGEKGMLKPLFVVDGRNVEDARNRAQQFLYKMIMNSDPDVSIRGSELEEKWHLAGRKMVTRDTVARLHGLKSQ